MSRRHPRNGRGAPGVLIYSHFFPPSVGGTEEVGLALAGGLARAGWRVTVATTTPGTDRPDWPFRALRQLSWPALIRAAAAADVVLLNSFSLKGALAAAAARRPFVAGVHIWLDHLRTPRHPVVLLRRAVLRLAAAVVCPSAALARSLGPRALVVPNPVDTAPFEEARRRAARGRSGILCAGRLVSDKGFDTAVEAVALLRDAGTPLPLRIIGDGPERGALQRLAAARGLGALVEFTGALPRQSLADEMARARFFLAPSRWAEPFGIVAVEALAAGCVTIVSDTGGLPEAVGAFGWTVPPGDAAALAACLDRLRYAAPPEPDQLRPHLGRFQPEQVVARWREILQKALA